jgi:hypothetical protein
MSDVRKVVAPYWERSSWIVWFPQLCSGSNVVYFAERCKQFNAQVFRPAPPSGEGPWRPWRLKGSDLDSSRLSPLVWQFSVA